MPLDLRKDIYCVRIKTWNLEVTVKTSYKATGKWHDYLQESEFIIIRATFFLGEGGGGWGWGGGGGVVVVSAHRRELEQKLWMLDRKGIVLVEELAASRLRV